MVLWLETIKAWFLPSPVETPSKPLASLPDEVKTTLTCGIQQLKSPQLQVEAVQHSLAQALLQWQHQPTLNSLVVLASPLEETSSLFEEVIQRQSPPLPVIYFPELRPENYQEIPQKLTTLVTEAEEKSIIVIPHLSACFLRCISGLDGIVTLRELTVRDTSSQEHFWLIGCNYWAWQYLDYICHTHACFEQTLSLPKLSDTDLSEWLQPLLEKEFLPELDSSSLKQLTQNSLGVGKVAAYLWLQSLRLQDEQIISVPPDLPKLPNLPWRDRYLLYSLLLHERLTLEELAESLGENSHVMRTYVQELRLAGLIQGNFKALEVNPLYYAQLRLELAQNNFSITGDN
jgi:hypothetical protein